MSQICKYILWHFSPIFKQIKYFVFFFLYFLLEYMIVYLPFFSYPNIYPNIYRNIQQQHNLSIAGLSDLFTDFQFFFFNNFFFFWGIQFMESCGQRNKKNINSKTKKKKVKMALQTREPLTDNYLHIVSLFHTCFYV